MRDEQRYSEAVQAARVKCWLGRYYCYCYSMRIDGVYVYPDIGFATEGEYKSFANAWQGQEDDNLILVVYHTKCPTDRYEPVITCPQCGQHIDKPVGLIPGKDVYCQSCQGFFTYH